MIPRARSQRGRYNLPRRTGDFSSFFFNVYQRVIWLSRDHFFGRIMGSERIHSLDRGSEERGGFHLGTLGGY